MGLAGNTLFPQTLTKKCIHIGTSSSVLEETPEFTKLVVSILDIHEYALSKGCFICQITCKTKRIRPQTTASEHNKVDCGDDAMFWCCGGGLASGTACIVHNGRSWCDGLGAFHIIAGSIRN